MIKDFNTDIQDRADATYIIYAILKSRPDDCIINTQNTKFIDYAMLRRFIKKIFKKSETISDFIEKFCIQLDIQHIDKKYIKDIDFENDNLLKVLNKDTFAIIALLQQRFAKDSEDFKKKNIDDEE